MITRFAEKRDTSAPQDSTLVQLRSLTPRSFVDRDRLQALGMTTHDEETIPRSSRS